MYPDPDALPLPEKSAETANQILARAFAKAADRSAQIARTEAEARRVQRERDARLTEAAAWVVEKLVESLGSLGEVRLATKYVSEPATETYFHLLADSWPYEDVDCRNSVFMSIVVGMLTSEGAEAAGIRVFEKPGPAGSGQRYKMLHIVASPAK